MARKKEKIDTTGGESLSADNPFAGLSGEGLKEVPRPAPPPDPGPKAVKKRGTVHLRRLKAGKGGKVVTEVSGFNAAPQQVTELLKRLQGRLGAGGTCKGKVIELQGECRDRVRPLLKAEGYTVKG